MVEPGALTGGPVRTGDAAGAAFVRGRLGSGATEARWVLWVLGGLAVAWVAVLWSNPLEAPIHHPDSPSFINFDPNRTAGYPVLLMAVIAVFGSVEAVAGVQLVLAAAAYVFLAWSVHRALGAPWTALLLGLALFAQPELPRFHPAVLTESVFVSLLAVLLGLLVRFVARPTAGCAAAVAVVCGLAAAMRPIALAVLPVWSVLLWLAWDRCAGRRLRLTVGVVTALAVCGAAERLAWAAWSHDDGRRSVVNLHLFGRALLLETVALPAQMDELDRALTGFRAELAPARQAIASVPADRVRLLLQTRVETLAPRSLFRSDLAALAGRRGLSTDQVQGVIGRRAAAATPGAWVRYGFDHYVSLWSRYDLLMPVHARDHAVHAARLNAVLPQEMPEIPIHRATSSRTWLIRAAMAAAFAATIGAIGLAAWQAARDGAAGLDAGLAVAAAAGALVHVNYLATALFGVATGRYAVVMWPLQAVCGLLLVRFLLQRAATAGRKMGWIA